MSGSNIQFGRRKSKDFFETAKKRVDQYFEEKKLSKHANGKMVMKTLSLWVLYFVLFGSILSNAFQGLPLILFFVVLGTTKGLIGFNMVHDALHGAYSSSPFLNSIMGYAFDLNGTSSYVWKVTHNGLHHVYTNIPGKDEDINHADFLRLSPKDPLRWVHRYQYIYAFFLYCVTTFNWVIFSDYKWFYGEWKKGKTPRKDCMIFLGMKLVNLILFLFLPLWFLDAPSWQIFLGFFGMHVGGGFPISVVFQLAHVVEGVEFPEPDGEGKIEEPWANHELRTTSNFARGSLLTTVLCGGLNYQVEHHLFPRICHIHYPEISKIVKRTAEEFHLPYNEHPTFIKALKSHIRTLKNMGRGLPPNGSKKLKRDMAAQASSCT